jgi:hypothetical protein
MPVTAAGLQQMFDNESLSLDWETMSEELRYAVLNLSRTLISKCADVEEPDAEKLAVDGFLESNALCGQWRLDCVSDEDVSLVRNFRRFAAHEDRGLSFIHYTTMFQYGGIGSGRSHGTDARDFYTKFFDSPICTTQSYLIPMYHRFISHFPEWARAEVQRASIHGEIRVVAGGPLSTVAKKRTIRRTVKKETTLEMFFQLGLGRLLTERLRMLGIRLSRQPHYNKMLAREGSVSGRYATIDLKSASDRIAKRMVREFFPVLACKAGSISAQTADIRGQQTPLNMISTMGNGFTFPLQTLIFVMVVHAAAAHVYGSRQKLRNGSWGVFGDDIVVPVELYTSVCRLCTLLGFEVNVDKSFANGSFRESCGGDYLNGVNVRGLYIKSLKRPQDRYNAANRLISWCVRFGIRLPKCIGYLLDGMPNRYVPMWQAVDAGLRTPFAVTDLTGRYSYWFVSPVQRSLEMEGDTGNYVAFLAGYLRTKDIPFKDGMSSRAFLTCVQQGYVGVPVENDDLDCQYTLRRRHCPSYLWDGWPADWGGPVKPIEVERYESLVLEVATRKRRHTS